jgi:glycosyltransferase involved in cell wall biosynthesis
MLARLYTDCWAPGYLSIVRKLPRPFGDFANRFHSELASGPVTAFNYNFLSRRLCNLIRMLDLSTIAKLYDEYLNYGGLFDRLVVEELRKGGGRAVDGLFAFSTTCLETLRFCKESGIYTVVDQIDAAGVDEDIVAEENRSWPGWEPSHTPIPNSYWERLSAEWATADSVLVNSKFSRDALVKQGVALSKILVSPLSFDTSSVVCRRVGDSSRSLRVLWLGNVSLRKGIQYLREAAELLRAVPIEFVVAGPVGIAADKVSSFPSNVRFVGKVSGQLKSEQYAWADVFVLPTLSDGFALTQLEAMSHGVPVIATANCGEVVSDGVDGFTIPIRSGRALADKLRLLESDRAMLEFMASNAIMKASSFEADRTLAELERNLQIHRLRARS